MTTYKSRFVTRCQSGNNLKGEYYTELETVAKSQGLEQSIKDHALYAKAESNIKNVITDSLSIFDGYTVKFE